MVQNGAGLVQYELSTLNALHGVVRIGPLQRYAGMFHGVWARSAALPGWARLPALVPVPSMIDLWASAAFGVHRTVPHLKCNAST